jgi:predicted enzyme related to lactoylglutathione lyase
MVSLRVLHKPQQQPANTQTPTLSRATTTRTSSTTPAKSTPKPSSTTGTKAPSSSQSRPKPPTAFAFTQITVSSFDRAEAFYSHVFNWRFLGEPTPATLTRPPLPTRLSSPSSTSDGETDITGSRKVAPPIAPPPDHRVNYFTAGDASGGGVQGGLFKFSETSKTVNHSGGMEGRVPSVIHYFAVEDMAVALNKVVKAGGKTVGEPWKERDEMARFALFEDTEGNVFGLIQYLM